MTAAVIRWQYEGKTSGPRYEAWREEFGRWWVRADLVPILDDRDDCVASEIAVSQLSFVTLGSVSCFSFSHPVARCRRPNTVGPAVSPREI
jgi:hypothetical protein